MTENQKLREALQEFIDAFDREDPTFDALAWVEHARQALAMPTAEPVGEREAFENEMRYVDVWGHRSLKKRASGNYENWQVNLMWDVWQARAALSAGDAGWQPIETAPKDGTNVLLINRKGNQAAGLWMNSLLGVGWYLRGGNQPDTFFNDHHGPTHWMPLPPPPSAIRARGEAV